MIVLNWRSQYQLEIYKETVGGPHSLSTVLVPAPLPFQEHLTSDYHTISASGVVKMFADGSPAEFIPLGDWVREHSVFNMMKQVCVGELS